MARFRYSGKLLNGQVVAGVTNARDASDLEATLIGRGVFVEEYSSSFSTFQQVLVSRFKRAEITRISRQISILLRGEVAILEALELVRDQFTDKTLRLVFDGITAQVESGKPVANAFGEYPAVFDELYVSLIKAGESSGALDVAFDRIASYREKDEAITGKVRSALAYPVLVVLVAVVVVFALVIYVVPVFSSIYAHFGADLPVLTGKVVRFSAFVTSTFWYWFSAVAVLAPMPVLACLFPRMRRLWHAAVLRAPLVRGLTIRIITARFCRTMGSLLTSGVDIISGLEIASKAVGNSHAAAKLKPAQFQLAQGKPFTEAVRSVSIFPETMLRLTASGEKTGRLGEMLSRAADYYEKEVDTQVSTVTSLIEPVTIIVLGVFVAFILVAMYLPLFDLVGAV